MSAVSAILGALALHFTGLGASWLQVPTALAAWGWQLSAGPGFTCAGQTSPIGCTASQKCTTADVSCDVVPDEGYKCNTTTTQIMCQQDAPDSPVFSPPSVEGSHGCKTASNQATIFWDPSVSCMNTPVSTSTKPSSTTTEKNSTTTEKHTTTTEKKHSTTTDKHSKDSKKQSKEEEEEEDSEKHSLSQRAVRPHDQDTVHFIQVPSADAKGSEL